MTAHLTKLNIYLMVMSRKISKKYDWLSWLFGNFLNDSKMSEGCDFACHYGFSTFSQSRYYLSFNLGSSSFVKNIKKMMKRITWKTVEHLENLKNQNHLQVKFFAKAPGSNLSQEC